MENKDFPSVVDIYNEILEGKRNRFPLYFWQECSEEEIREIIRYLVESRLKLSEQEILNINSTFLKKYKLSYLLNKLYNGSPFAVIDFVYPNKFNAWEFNQVPNAYWTEETCQKAITWLIKKYNWTKEQFVSELSVAIMEQNKLGGMLDVYFQNCIFNIVEFMYPHEYKVWQFNKVPKNYWTETTRKECMSWLCYKFEEIHNIKKADIVDMGLGGMFIKFYNNNLTRLKVDLENEKAKLIGSGLNERGIGNF